MTFEAPCTQPRSGPSGGSTWGYSLGCFPSGSVMVHVPRLAPPLWPFLSHPCCSPCGSLTWFTGAWSLVLGLSFTGAFSHLITHSS